MPIKKVINKLVSFIAHANKIRRILLLYNHKGYEKLTHLLCHKMLLTLLNECVSLGIQNMTYGSWI